MDLLFRKHLADVTGAYRQNGNFPHARKIWNVTAFHSVIDKLIPIYTDAVWRCYTIDIWYKALRSTLC